MALSKRGLFMRQQGMTVIQLVITVGLTLFASVVVLLPMFARSSGSRRSPCQSNLRQITLGIKQYVQDYDERFPVVAVNDRQIDDAGPLGWADAVSPYIKDVQVFTCPERNRKRQNVRPRDAGYTDYWYNANLASLSENKLEYIASTIMNGDGNDGTDINNARYSLKAMPDAWLRHENTPASCHLGGANYSFADGHVKWLKAAPLFAAHPSMTSVSFAIR